MPCELKVGDLIKNGKVFYNVVGNTPIEIYKNVCNRLSLPENITGEMLFTELEKREQLLSTGVGNGIAIPHPTKPIFSEESSQQIVVCFSKNTIEMDSPDGRGVNVFFILLTNSKDCHLHILSYLAAAMQKDEVKRALGKNIFRKKPSKRKLVKIFNT